MGRWVRCNLHINLLFGRVFFGDNYWIHSDAFVFWGEKQIKDLQKAQLELIEQSEKQIKVIEGLLPVHDESPKNLHDIEVNTSEGFEEKKTSKFNSAGK